MHGRSQGLEATRRGFDGKVTGFCQSVADHRAGSHLGLPALGVAEDQARRAWNAMGGQLVWPAVPMMIDLFEVADVELFVHALITFRDAQECRDGG